MENQRVTVKEASELLGIPAATIRYRLEKEMHLPESEKTFQIGQAHRSVTGKRKKLVYDIYKSKLLAYAGLDKWPE
ncbi:MAG: hypothetical protein LUG62_05555 [Clostridiales bacterium]|nr:hypothetical protein [Clostridiales bacterium]